MTSSTPVRSRWLRLLHLVGYVTTALVAAQLIFLAYMVVPEWWGDRQRDAAQRENTRTHVGALAERRPGQVSDWMTGLLAALPKDGANASDSIRIAIAPSSSARSYAVALTPTGTRDGPIDVDYVTVTEDLCDVQIPLKIESRTFVISQSDYRPFVKWFDATTGAYRGSDEGWLDGLVVAFERKKADKVMSGVGNIPGHHGLLAARLHALLKPHLIGPAIPIDESWRSPDEDRGCET